MKFRGQERVAGESPPTDPSHQRRWGPRSAGMTLSSSFEFFAIFSVHRRPAAVTAWSGGVKSRDPERIAYAAFSGGCGIVATLPVRAMSRACTRAHARPWQRNFGARPFAVAVTDFAAFRAGGSRRGGATDKSPERAGKA
jgi:hypothetical protein